MNDNKMLSMEEVREHLKNNLPLKLNKETERTKEWYLNYYMAKNLYWIQCTNMSKFNTESGYRSNVKDLQYISLTPSGHDENNRYLKIMSLLIIQLTSGSCQGKSITYLRV